MAPSSRSARSSVSHSSYSSSGLSHRSPCASRIRSCSRCMRSAHSRAWRSRSRPQASSAAAPRRVRPPCRHWRPHSSRVTLTVRDATERLVEHIATVVVGKREVTEQLLGALLVEGHVLLDDVPGVGKTTLARAVARSLDLSFRRIQCTPDLVPSDITGVSIYDQRAGAFEYRPGPLSANVVLVDEINRATPRAQSALLEAMQERQVTVDETTHALPDPFIVIATQNPVELEGTFPLPEAQLDRFLFLLNLGYPDADDEDTILRLHGPASLMPEALSPLFDAAAIAALRSEVRAVRVGDAVRRYAVEIAMGERRSEPSQLSSSPRSVRSH